MKKKKPGELTLGKKHILRLLASKGYRDTIEETGWSNGNLNDLRNEYRAVYDDFSASYKADPVAFAAESDPDPIPRNDWPSDPVALRQLVPEEVHPAADDYDLWSVATLHARAEMLKTTRHLPEPIKRLKSTGQLLDGRNRRIICVLSGVRPQFDDVELPVGREIADYIEEINVFNRQFTPGQLAARAAERYIRLRELGKLRRRRNLPSQKSAPVKKASPELAKLPNQGSSLEYLAKLFGVSAKYIQDAAAIKEENPDLFLALKRGKTSMADARRLCGLTEPRAKKPSGDTKKVGADGVAPKIDPQVAASTVVAPKVDSKATDNSRLLKLAHAVDKACSNLSTSLTPALAAARSMARKVIQDLS